MKDAGLAVGAGMVIGAAAWWVAQKVAELRAELAIARWRAERDPLTGLYNRAGFAGAAQAQLRTAGAHLVLLVDLDDFKPVNDNLGHQVGDQALTEIGHRLAAYVDGRGVAARLGGDEFAAVISVCDAADADATVWTVRQRLAEPMCADGFVFAVWGSVGVARTDGVLRTESVHTLLSRADAAMYRAKRTGTGVAFYDPDTDAGWQNADGVRPAVRRRERLHAPVRPRPVGEVDRDAA
ncbi:MAG: GGDEF domain-containing protein [Micromonosporaceae bacterium]